MTLTLPIVILLCLLVMFYQDIKHRHIHIIAPVVLFSCTAYAAFKNYNEAFLNIILLNLAFLFITFAALIGYMSVRRKKFLNPFKNYFGLGDLLFYVAVSPLFLLHNYVLFFIASLIFTLVLFYFFKRIINAASIPLAGFASVLLAALLCFDILVKGYSITLIN
jgi:hypothetical protein